MSIEKTTSITVVQHLVSSVHLGRDVKVDCYIPSAFDSLDDISLLLVNDGQDLVSMNFENILDELYQGALLRPLLCVALHCSADRKNEYGTANQPDYKGRGAKAFLYTKFVFQELLPFIRETFSGHSFSDKAFAGFSLGGLSALDIVWNYPHEFTKVGVFSGSFWWRDRDQADADFDEDTDRIMHRLVREGDYASWLKFYFEVGTKDETADRNNNGVIDAIDDTRSLIEELVQKGYHRPSDIRYLELQDGRHDVPTWAKAFPDFLKWGWGVEGLRR